jgi:hypothetical protein
MQRLALCHAVMGPNIWIGAGFLRNLIWDRDFGHGGRAPPGDDIDVLFFDPTRMQPDHETAFEPRLAAKDPTALWQVRNQARMHVRHGDRPYHDIRDAMSFWLETATAIAVRKGNQAANRDRIEVTSAYGLQDLFDGILRPTSQDRMDRFLQRVAQKNWRKRWPGIKVLAEEPYQ